MSLVSLVSGEVAHCVCHHGYTVDGNTESSVIFSTTCSSNGSFAPEPPASCQPMCVFCCQWCRMHFPLGLTCKPGYSSKVDDFKRAHTTLSFLGDVLGEFDVVQECINIDDCLESDFGAACAKILPIPHEAMLTRAPNVTVGVKRLRCAEVLFQPGYQSNKKCEIYIRKELCAMSFCQVARPCSKWLLSARRKNMDVSGWSHVDGPLSRNMATERTTRS